MHKLLIAIVLAVVPAMAQWQEFITLHGKVPLPQLGVSPFDTMKQRADFFGKTEQAYIKYASLVISTVYCQGNLDLEKIEYDWNTRPKQNFNMILWFNQSGLSIRVLIEENTPYVYSPEQFSSVIIRKWNSLHDEFLYRNGTLPESTEYVLRSPKALWNHIPQEAKCMVVFQYGMTCTVDLGKGSVHTKPIP